MEKHLTDELFNQTEEELSSIQKEILFVRVYGTLQALEQNGHGEVAELVKDQIQFMLDNVRKSKEGQA